VVTVFFGGLFVVGPGVILDVCRISTVIDSIKTMKHSARLMFGANSDKPPAPILVKELVLMLIAAGMLKCQHVLTAGKSEAGSDECDLALGVSTSGPDGTILGLCDDSFWRRLPLTAAQQNQMFRRGTAVMIRAAILSLCQIRGTIRPRDFREITCPAQNPTKEHC
jgi:hypothetical protein